MKAEFCTGRRCPQAQHCKALAIHPAKGLWKEEAAAVFPPPPPPPVTEEDRDDNEEEEEDEIIMEESPGRGRKRSATIRRSLRPAFPPALLLGGGRGEGWW